MIQDKIDQWTQKKVTADLYEQFTGFFTAREVLDCADVWIDSFTQRPKESFENGGAVFATIAWLLRDAHGGHWDVKLVDRICAHYGFDYKTVTPRSALRKALCARLYLRRADEQLGKLWPVNKDLVEAVVCKLDGAHDVYELNTEVLDTILHN